MNKSLPKRKNLRLKEYDYNSAGFYFITICTLGRRNILSSIVGGDVLDAPRVELTAYGKATEKYINQFNDYYEKISVKQYVIMPNHIHMILFIHPDGASRTSPPTVKQHSVISAFVSTFKRFCNKEYGENIWQRYFYDHVIRDERDYNEISTYICQNPIKWQFDKLYCKE